MGARRRNNRGLVGIGVVVSLPKLLELCQGRLRQTPIVFSGCLSSPSSGRPGALGARGGSAISSIMRIQLVDVAPHLWGIRPGHLGFLCLARGGAGAGGGAGPA